MIAAQALAEFGEFLNVFRYGKGDSEIEPQDLVGVLQSLPDVLGLGTPKGFSGVECKELVYKTVKGRERFRHKINPDN